MLCLQFSSERTRKGKPSRNCFVHIRKAYFNSKPTRNLFMHLPKVLGLAPTLLVDWLDAHMVVVAQVTSGSSVTGALSSPLVLLQVQRLLAAFTRGLVMLESLFTATTLRLLGQMPTWMLTSRNSLSISNQTYAGAWERATLGPMNFAQIC